MKYLPALAALLSLLACVLWIASLSEPWYHAPNKDGTEQRMGLYSSCTSKEYGDHHGHNMMADAMGITAMQHEYELAQRHKHDDDDDEYEHHHEHHHRSKHHKHGQYDDEEEEEKGKDHHKGEDKGKGNQEYPTLQPIIIQPTLPPNMNAPATQAPMQPQPTGPGDLQVGGGGAGGGGFGPFGGGGGGGGGMPIPTPGPTALPVDDVPAGPVATPVPTSKHGRVYHDRGQDQEHESEHEHGHKHKHEHDEKNEKYDDMILNQVSAGTQTPQTSQGVTHEHYLKKKHGTKHEIERTNAFPYDETWVMAMRILLILAIIVSGIAALLQLLMAWTVGQALHKGSWTTSPTTAIITTTLITLAGIHGLIVLFLFLSKRKELPSDGHYDYGHTLNIIATVLSFLSPILFWYTLDTHTKYESLLGEETLAGGRRKYASVE